MEAEALRKEKQAQTDAKARRKELQRSIAHREQKRQRKEGDLPAGKGLKLPWLDEVSPVITLPIDLTSEFQDNSSPPAFVTPPAATLPVKPVKKVSDKLCFTTGCSNMRDQPHGKGWKQLCYKCEHGAEITAKSRSKVDSRKVKEALAAKVTAKQLKAATTKRKVDKTASQYKNTRTLAAIDNINRQKRKADTMESNGDSSEDAFDDSDSGTR